MCAACAGFGTVLPVYRRPASEMWSEPAQCQSAADLMHVKRDCWHSENYPPISIGRASLVALYGAPGAGKTVMLLKLLDGIVGAVLLLSVEEGLSTGMVSKLQWLEIQRPDFFLAHARTLSEIDALVGQHNVIALGIDSLSVSTLSLDDLLRMRNALRLPIFFTLHIRKDGLVAGEMALMHGTDIVIRVDAMQWAVEKSRFSGLVSGSVLSM